MKPHLSRAALLACFLLGIVVPARGAARKDRYGDPVPDGAWVPRASACRCGAACSTTFAVLARTSAAAGSWTWSWARGRP